MTLEEARKKARYSQEAVAGELGISRPTYAKMEKNPDIVTIEDAKKLAQHDIVDEYRCYEYQYILHVELLL